MIDSNLPAEPLQPTPTPTPQAFNPALFAGRNGGGGGGASGEGEVKGVQWGRYLDALKRNSWIVLLVAAIGSTGAYVLGRMVKPIFTVELKVWVNQQSAALPNHELLAPLSWTPLLQSFQVIDPVVEKLRLAVVLEDATLADTALNRTLQLDSVYTAGEYVLTVDDEGKTVSLERFVNGEPKGRHSYSVGDSICPRCGFKWLPPKSALPPKKVFKFTVRTQRAAAKSLIARVQPAIGDLNANFINLTMEGTNGGSAARQLNAVARQFVKTADSLKKAALMQQRRFVGEQLDIAQRTLTNVERELQQFQVETITKPTATDVPVAAGLGETRSTVIQAFIQLKTQYDQTRRDRNTLERMFEDAKAKGTIIPEQSLLAVPTVTSAAPSLKAAYDQLNQARLNLALQTAIWQDTAPPVQTLRRQITTLEKETIPQITANAIQGFAESEATMKARIDSQAVELQQIPVRTIEEQRLSRLYKEADGQFTGLRAKADELRLSDAQIAPDLVLLDTAEAPLVPSSQSGPRLFVLGIIASLALGVALAILRDLVDRRFRYPDQATVDLGLTIAGTVPKFRANRRGDLSITSQSQIVESFRTLRLGVRHYFPANEPVVVAVTSPGPGEGKSLVSANIAIAFANSGQKTLLIDGDVRRGVVHTTFDTKRRPGLVDYLAGHSTAEEVVQPTSTQNLSIIPSGSRNRKAPELLVSERMNELVQAMRKEYEVVVIDAPPFAAGMDAFALSACAGHALIVLRPGTTDRKLAAMKLEILDRLPVGIIGAVLNGISGSGAYRYYYSDYADYRDDMDGDGDEDETDLDTGRLTEAGPPRLVKRN